MGIMGIGSSGVSTITFKKADGTVAGTMGVSKPKTKKKKKLNYNYKEISAQIMRARTSINARQVLTKAFSKVAMLSRQLRSGEYDEKEVEKALIHAKQIAHVAKKRMKHLQEEERLKRGGPCDGQMEEKEEEFRPENPDLKGTDSVELDSEEMRKLMEELGKELGEELEEALKEIEDMAELEELAAAAKQDMDPEDLELLKKKHRADELREIAEADMKYLRALFDKLEKDKQEVANNVALELAGIEMPAAMTEVPAADAGGSIDVSL